MKTKKLTPRNSAPVQRENTATVSRDGNAIAPNWNWVLFYATESICGRRCGVIPLILARTLNHVKSLFLLARVRGLPL
jgi:prenylated cyclic peptide (anacyclamide/piricyclamide family)